MESCLAETAQSDAYGMASHAARDRPREGRTLHVFDSVQRSLLKRKNGQIYFASKALWCHT